MNLPTEPVRQTCPDIDSIVSTLTQIVKDMDACNSEDTVQDFMDFIADWKHDICSIGVGGNSELEYLRSCNAALRDWGKELYEIAENLQYEVQAAEDKLYLANAEVENLTWKLDD